MRLRLRVLGCGERKMARAEASSRRGGGGDAATATSVSPSAPRSPPSIIALHSSCEAKREAK